MIKNSRRSAALIMSFALLLALLAASPDCSAEDSDVYFISDGDFNSAANWDNGLVPSLVITPPKTVPNIYGIDDGHAATFSGGTTTVFGLRVGSGAKEHYPGGFGETHFGRLTMTGGSLEVIGDAAMGLFGIGRERQNRLIGADYNKDSLVDAADYTVWRDKLGLISGCANAGNPSISDSCADGSGPTPGVPDGVVDTYDYDYWKASYGNSVKGGEIIMTGNSTLTANGVIVGERTKALFKVGPNAIAEFRTWIPATVVEPVVPAHFGGTEDMRIGGFGPAYEQFGQPGLDGNGLVDVEGTLNAKVLLISEHGSKGELRLSGGTVNLNGALDMNRCDGCYVLPAPADPDYPVILALLAQRSAKVSIVGSSGTFNVGLDPDTMVVDPMPPNRDLLANSPTAVFSFTADAGGVTPITVAENIGELSGTANIAGAKLELNLDAYTFASPLTLINAAPGNLSGMFGAVTFLGSRTATVNYDVTNGDVFLSNFLNGAGAGSLAATAVPEPSSLMMVVTLGLFLISMGVGANRQRARLWGLQCLKIRA
jgi:hypothetical protein